MQVNVAGLRRNIKNLAHNYSDAQVKVREATSNDPWGPSARIMAEIADLTHNVVAFSEIMQMIWKRLNDHGKNWRHVYKALILLEYLIKTGSEKVAQQCKENIFAIQTLREFVYFEEGKDQGTHVREKAKQLVNLLKDDERLKNERIKALKAKERFAQQPSGFGSDGYIDAPSQRDMPPGWQEEPKPVSELEMVRPQTAGEEELQLQLAMAMSREEAEQEEAKRRSDDVRLQLALSQSEQDFKQKKEEPQSHLLDLLDISLGATSISSPPLGATGGVGTDPWGTPARAASQLSDPWSGTSSPQIDPWQPSAAMRLATASAPLGAVGGVGSGTNGDAWGLRTQSPSVASGSSTEGWLQSNGGAMNGNSIGATAVSDPWLSKTQMVPVAAAPADPWLADSAKPAAPALLPDDPWAPKAAGSSDDPWKTVENVGAKKSSLELDDFDIISNRNKTGDLLSNNAISGPNNNNASLLDEMDPLSVLNSSSAVTTNTKKPLKTPQAFLGENSSLVNLDNLIKPVQTQPQIGSAAYNPFSDTVIPPKTNLFQQQQPAVPSINQLKQQQPFPMTVNQDPWAPVANTNAVSQSTRNLFNYDCDDFSVDCRPQLPIFNQNNSAINCNNNNNNNSTITNTKNSCAMQYSKSDYDVFNTSYISNEFLNYNGNQLLTQAQVHSQSVDNIRNLQLTSDSDTDIYEQFHSPFNAASTTADPVIGAASQFTLNTSAPAYATSNQINNNSSIHQSAMNNYFYPTPSPQVDATFPSSYSSALTAALAATPGIKITSMPDANAGAGVLGSTMAGGGSGGGGGSLFSYGFFESNGPNVAASSSSSSLTSNMGNCKLENNNNMPWMKPDAAASSSNPFLS